MTINRKVVYSSFIPPYGFYRVDHRVALEKEWIDRGIYRGPLFAEKESYFAKNPENGGKMAYADLREFMHDLEQHGELVRVKVAVEKDHEIGAICRKVNDMGGPALLFENVKGYNIPLLCNIFGTRKRFAMALGSNESDFKKMWLQRAGGPLVDAIIVSQGASQEN